jgi:hypothetical protein
MPSLQRVVELHESRAHVERALAEIVSDEPGLGGARYPVVAVDLGGAEPRIAFID